MSRRTTCREPGCGRPVEMVMLWSLDEVKRRGERAKWMPLDVTQHARDDVLATIAVSGVGALRGRVLKIGEEPLADEVRRMTHFATCAARERQKRQRAALAVAQAAGAGNVVPFRRRPRVPALATARRP